MPMQHLLDEIDELAELEDGWYDGEGLAMRRDALADARNLAGSLSEGDVPAPHAFPSPEGSVLIEWSLPDIMASIEFGTLDAGTSVSALNVRSDRSLHEEHVEATAVYAINLLKRIQSVDS